MSQNNFSKYSYRKASVYPGVYVYKVSNGSKTLWSPNITESNKYDSKIQQIESQMNNFMYYVDNGANAYNNILGSVFLDRVSEQTGSSKANIALNIFNALTSDATTAEKVIAVLKTLAAIPNDLMGIIDPFFIGDCVIVATNKYNCSYVFNKLDSLM